MKKNKYAIFGYLIIILGIVILLYFFGRISISNLTADTSYKVYIESRTETTPEEVKAIEHYNDNIVNNLIVDPFDNGSYKVRYDIYPQDPDRIFAYLVSDAIALKEPVYLGATDDHLDRGVAHIHGTSLPVGGNNRRSVIAGHRGWYGATVFLYLDRLQPGDAVKLIKDGRTLNYIVNDKEVIDPDEWEKLQPREGQDILTLMTCDPPYPPFPDRLLINCVRAPGESGTFCQTKIVPDPHSEPSSAGSEADTAEPGSTVSPSAEPKPSDAENLPEQTAGTTEVVVRENTVTVDTRVKTINTLIYVIAVILIFALIFVLIRFIRYLVGNRPN